MKHFVHFHNADNHWDNGLPIGNGCFGAMLYFEDGKLYMPMNHYEVYYNISAAVLPADKLKATPVAEDPGYLHRRYRTRADANVPQNGETFTFYGENADKAFDPEPYAIGWLQGSYPPTGNLEFTFDGSLMDADRKLTLTLEDADATLVLEGEGDRVEVRTIAARCDCLVSRVTQTRDGLLKTLRVAIDPQRNLEMPQIQWRQIDETTFSYEVSRTFEGKETPFVFAGILKLLGAEGTLTEDATGMNIAITASGREFTILTGIFTDFRYAAPVADGLTEMAKFARSLPEIYADHAAYWTAFFDRSGIDLPDKFLEHIYYVNQYALDACSGRDGVMKHHACGLNGLWDVKHPSLWGSMWYWDVNIQASFAGVFSSNRLELAKVFSDGLLSYTELAERWAHDRHNLPGCAMDHPYQDYYCVWPWCAQYLWQLYEYSLDEAYLRNEAYPLFLKLCTFAVNLFEYDEKTDSYFVYPDISPEQGPLAHNTTITVACTKYLLQFTLEAARILGDESPLLEDCRRLLEKLPPYALSENGHYGVHINDSHDAPDQLFLRHPSMLMPLFPIGEYGVESPAEMREIWMNTLRYLEERCEIGIFGGSWLAAGAARLGNGQMALRLLYERGIDHMLRSNGLTAEQTERFINYCLITRQPLYYPCMMEFTGEMLAAVNEMLLQSVGGVIRVFPAIPDGDMEWYRMHSHGYRLSEYQDRFAEYPAWDNVGFQKLLAKGGFEVSAALRGGKLARVDIHSRKGGKVRLASPFLTKSCRVFRGGLELTSRWEEDKLCFDTLPGCHYLVAEAWHEEENTAPQEEKAAVQSRMTYTKRHIYIGENPDTAYWKALDGSIRDWYYGNMRMSNHTVYKFDFGTAKEKCYTDSFPRQAIVAEERGITSLPFVPVTAETRYTTQQGYGFASCEGLFAADAQHRDALRADFVGGTEEAAFMIEVPRGQYELLVISGDAQQDTVTVLSGPNGFCAGGNIVKKGTWQCELIPVILKKDGPLTLRIRTQPGYGWRINAVIMNTWKGY